MFPPVLGCFPTTHHLWQACRILKSPGHTEPEGDGCDTHSLALSFICHRIICATGDKRDDSMICFYFLCNNTFLQWLPLSSESYVTLAFGMAMLRSHQSHTVSFSFSHESHLKCVLFLKSSMLLTVTYSTVTPANSPDCFLTAIFPSAPQETLRLTFWEV